jgi:hypothetical protein
MLIQMQRLRQQRTFVGKYRENNLNDKDIVQVLGLGR